MEKILLGGYVDEEVKKLNENFTEIESDYAKKTDVPSVPTNVSSFTNDANYQTETEVNDAISQAVGAVAVPTKTSELTNDSGYQTATQVQNTVNEAVENVSVPTKLSELTNDANYVKTTDTAFVNKVDKEDGKQLSTNDYTTAEKNKVANLGKIDFTTSDFGSTADTNGNYTATLSASGIYPVKVMRQNGNAYEEVLAHTSVSGSNILIVSATPFAGYVVTI